MKHLRKLLIIAGMAVFVSACGTSADEEAEQKRLDSLKQDSIMKVEEQARLDSIAKVEQERMEKEKMIADSLHQDSVEQGLIQ